VNPGTGISDGAENGKYWSRRWISQADTPLVPGDRFEERIAYVLFRCSKDKPLDDFFEWERRIRQRFGLGKRRLCHARKSKGPTAFADHSDLLLAVGSGVPGKRDQLLDGPVNHL